MPDWLQPEYDRYRSWIQQERDKQRGWDEILLGGAPKEGLDGWLGGLERYANWPSLGDNPTARAEAWQSIVAGKRHWEEEALRNGRVPIVVGPDATDRAVTIPEDDKSSWQSYKRHLKKNEFRQESIDSIESSSFRILRKLRFDTSKPPGAVKGMVVGHVQSGKTASMAGLISMAMDWGWNFVIVLTGTIENLRKQTFTRLLEDLNHGGNLSLRPISQPRAGSPEGERAQDLRFEKNSNTRYLTVLLKNATRLSNLLSWLRKDQPSLAQMRILIIDDEADQASIDTNPKEVEERSRINKLIVELTEVAAPSVNYVAYTATPYANFLNEAWPEGLYPKSFIIALPQSPEHFGPKQVFGIKETESEGGLGIVQEVPETELQAVRAIQTEESSELPQSLKDAVLWFFCAAAAIRAYGNIKKPVSMLVHTSMTQSHHAAIAEAITEWLRVVGERDFQRECERIWKDRTADLSLEKFSKRWGDYGRLSELRDYPRFQEIWPHIRELFKKITHIQMETKDDEQVPKYHSGVHVCIDNCANNGVNDENEHVRLLYPSKSALAGMSFVPAFLVIGGNTLSRGLTIENLVSTFFLRSGAQMDSLMQMGRWFGFRRGYELLPRIWTPKDTKEKFEFMARVEHELRDELALFMDGGRNPSEYGPRVLVHPSASWLRPTAENRMQEKQGAEFDFSGVNTQTTIFHSRKEDAQTLRDNIAVAEDFLSSLSGPGSSSRPGTVVWKKVPFDAVAGMLRKLKMHSRVRFSQEVEPFLKWFKDNQKDFDAWNVVAGGTQLSGKADDSEVWKLPGGHKIGKVNRSKLVNASNPDSVGIGTLRDPPHLVADADNPPTMGSKIANRQIAAARKAAGLGSTPQLLLYRINKDSEPVSGETGERAKLGVPEDLIGVSIWMPHEGKSKSKTSYATHVSVRIPQELRDEAEAAAQGQE